ncbi:MAG: 50S ribosomal protein L13 [Candidatus Vogelbacteria bacterium CG22_combo_CG10-13_8_21_14_all_37_9]|uniref:50S ribosomal protein L13 n=1 Tax=Candidatus Vogelbacteria bacterium CG22_combo_CG10-13_8_21_14_all_37_9 TaxID=1975046 RepID=A0A2H0BKN5_9BACT|nr:MAG: 50S ribosomal protein L13 [bacterium CG10_37_50]PIP58232.1 MAG: 50S ribosomal protein L13 [Candidatus Vogelbacteria bacterium CG22_combo_CG10-13_8_21_14_all_37_9]
MKATPSKTKEKKTKVSPVLKGETFVLDATNQSLGRVASQAAKLLRGKNSPFFQLHLAPVNKVVINKAGLLKISEKKALQKIYFHHTGYPGNAKYPTLSQVVSKKGKREILQMAIKGMMPANRLRPIALKNLTINE